MCNCFLLVVTLLWCSSLAQAQNPLQSRVSLSYQGTPASPVFQALADVLGYQLRLDTKVTGTVTLDVRNVTAETVLRAICESIGCRWRVEAGTLHVDYDAAAGAQGQGDRYALWRRRLCPITRVVVPWRERSGRTRPLLPAIPDQGTLPGDRGWARRR